jgi:hypothetical protein
MAFTKRANPDGTAPTHVTEIPLLVDTEGRLYTVPVEPSSGGVVAGQHQKGAVALTAGENVYAAACALKTVWGYNAGSQQLYVQLFDKATAPSAADVPVAVIPVPPNRARFSLTQAIALAAGMSIGISSTEFTYTSAGSYLYYFATVTT